LDGFPETITGRGLLLPVDNLNTDGIYGKDVTYRDDLTPAQMATHAMANYAPEFQEIAASGDIIIAGRNFGTGSSREQAATALKYRGIQMVVAASFSQTYLKNAFNNAFICLESPELSEAARAACADQKGTVLPVGDIVVDIRRAEARWKGHTYAVSPLGPTAQELVLAGGLEALVRQRLENNDRS
jgi:homoaconitate hydratase